MSSCSNYNQNTKFCQKNMTLDFFLQGFLYFILWYHVIHTLVVYGQKWLSLGVFSSSKEFIFLWLVCLACWQLRHKIGILWMKFRQYIVVMIAIISLFLLVSWLHNIPLDSILVWFKYDLWWIIILLWSMLIGIALFEKNEHHIFFDYRRISRLIWYILIAGILWQWAKIYFPDFFTWRWYGPIGDYSLWNNPPIWYRTGPWGWMRFSGIFSGPNNLAYLLIWFFPLVLYSYLQKNYNRFLVLSMLLAIFATMSRAAIAVALLQTIVLLYLYRPLWRKYLSLSILIMIAWSFWLLLWKWGSTQEHLLRFLEWLQVVLQYPRWLWLWVAGPSIHYHGIYLPENQYLQRAIDGWILWCIAIFFWIYIIHLPLLRNIILKVTCPQDYTMVRLLSMGFFGILIIGLFLHSLEDSMVNYVFFSIYWIQLWSFLNKKTYNQVKRLWN